MTITLTKFPERMSGMGLSLSVGGSTPPPSSYTPYVKIWTDSGETIDTFEEDTIPPGYYSGRTDILAVEVGSGITIGGEEVWKNCTNISAVTLNGAGTIKAHSFQKCTSLTQVSISDRYTRLEGWVFSACTSLTSITIPDSVTLIGGYTFQDCKNLQEITLGSGLTTLNRNVFASCESLTAVTLPQGLTTLGQMAFNNCKNLVSVNIPTGLTSIITQTFLGCKSLASITLHSGITSLQNSVFQGCESLASITCYRTTPPSLGNNYVFSGVAEEGTLFIPTGSDYSTWMAELPSGWVFEDLPEN